MAGPNDETEIRSPARCLYVTDASPSAATGLQLVRLLLARAQVEQWPFAGVQIGEDGRLLCESPRLVLLAPGFHASRVPAAFVQAAGCCWRWKSREDAAGAWQRWMEVFVGTAAVLGDGVGLFRAPRHSVALGDLLSGLMHDLQGAKAAEERVRFARLLTRHVDRMVFTPLVCTCDWRMQRDWFHSAPLAVALRDCEARLAGRAVGPVPARLYDYWPRLCQAYRAATARLRPASAEDLSAVLQPLVAGCIGFADQEDVW